MSTDRELLDLAAKAAGVGPLDFDYPEREGHGFYIGPRLPMPQGVVMAAMWTYWNPLTDDGDALRLAVRLRLGLDIVDYGTSVRAAGQWYGSEAHLHGGIESATRSAIVRAAAEIGKAMP